MWYERKACKVLEKYGDRRGDSVPNTRIKFRDETPYIVFSILIVVPTSDQGTTVLT